jgi:hypothetical protein
MSTIREHPEPKVDVQGCRSVNCCTALLRDFGLGVNVNRTSLATYNMKNSSS